jgi:hypothetical protein
LEFFCDFSGVRRKEKVRVWAARRGILLINLRVIEKVSLIRIFAYKIVGVGGKEGYLNFAYTVIVVYKMNFAYMFLRIVTKYNME